MESKGYRLKFIKAIENITNEPYKNGIKKFKFCKYGYNMNSTCICTHTINNIYIASYKGTIYEIGSECQKNFKEFLTDEQIEKCNELKTEYKNNMKRHKEEMKMRSLDHIEKLKKIYNEEKTQKEYIYNNCVKLLNYENKVLRLNVYSFGKLRNIKDGFDKNDIKFIKYASENRYINEDDDLKDGLERLVKKKILKLI